MAIECPPLCIIQARYHSTRLPGKMLLNLPNGRTLIGQAWATATMAFGKEHSVVAIPPNDAGGPLHEELQRMGAHIFVGIGAENDVLSRYYQCAHTYRWRPESVIVRYTPDDYRKHCHALRSVAGGVRLPVEIGGEAFTLAHLSERHQTVAGGTQFGRADWREHISYALFDVPPPPPPPGCWTIDTHSDYEAACAWLDINSNPIALDQWEQCRVLHD